MNYCPKCGSPVKEDEKFCGNCGASLQTKLPHPTPETIEEMRAWYVAHDLPPEDVTRFFIGSNHTGPRAFGIYREGDDFIVYKNKDDGSRAIRYQGSDEAHAVNELYLRLKQEIANQKRGNAFLREKQTRTQKITWIIICAVFAVIMLFTFFFRGPDRGYYRYGDDYYYYQNGEWYWYDGLAWGLLAGEDYPQELVDNYGDYYQSGDYNSAYGTDDFSATEYYRETDTDSSWDSGSDSWDSGSTDWGSDW